MKYILNTTILLALLFSQTACDEDFFTQVVEVDIPEHESAIVLNGVWSNQDTVFYITVTNSLGIIDRAEHTYPTDAIVKLYKDDNFESDLLFDPVNATYLLPENIFMGEEGAIYKIEAQFGTLKAVSSSQTMPSKVEITAAEYEKEGAPGQFGEKMDKHIITFSDPADEDNYYAVTASRERQNLIYIQGSNPAAYDTITSLTQLYLDSNDPTVSYSQLGLVFSDKAFNGQTYSLRATSYTWWGNPEDESKIQYQLLNISKEAYLYYKSLNAYYDAQDNPFAEPATVYSNVTDGYGIFGLMAADTISITP